MRKGKIGCFHLSNGSFAQGGGDSARNPNVAGNFAGRGNFPPDLHYYYGQYYAAQAMWTAGDTYWKEWYPAIRDELIARFDAHDVWWAPVNTPAEVLTDPQAVASGAFVDVPEGAGAPAFCTKNWPSISTMAVELKNRSTSSSRWPDSGSSACRASIAERISGSRTTRHFSTRIATCEALTCPAARAVANPVNIWRSARPRSISNAADVVEVRRAPIVTLDAVDAGGLPEILEGCCHSGCRGRLGVADRLEGVGRASGRDRIRPTGGNSRTVLGQMFVATTIAGLVALATHVA